MRSGWVVAAAIIAGFAALLGVVALIGDDDDRGETVSASEWADGVCGTVLVWRGEMESIVDGVRAAGGAGTSGSESGAESPQGGSGSVRTGLEQALLATETMVVGISRAGIPNTPNGQDVADGLSGWADDAVDEIERAQDALSEETGSTSDELAQLAAAVGTIVDIYASGGQAVADAAVEDQELLSALTQSATCENLKEEASS